MIQQTKHCMQLGNAFRRKQHTMKAFCRTHRTELEIETGDATIGEHVEKKQQNSS